MADLTYYTIGATDRRAPLADFALLLVRAFFGLALALAHGLGKVPVGEPFIAGVAALGFPAPALFAWAAALSELVGGLLLALGLFTRPAALAILFTMGVAAFARPAADPFGERELALAYFAVALGFLLLGAGRYSLDAVLRNRREG